MLDLLQPRVGGWRLRRLSGKARRDEPERQGHARAIELVAVRASTHGTAASRGLLLRPPGSLGCQPATSLERSAPAIARSAAEGSSSFIRPSWVVREKKFYRTHSGFSGSQCCPEAGSARATSSPSAHLGLQSGEPAWVL